MFHRAAQRVSFHIFGPWHMRDIQGDAEDRGEQCYMLEHKTQWVLRGKCLLSPDSAPVLSQSEGRQSGTLQQGASAERPRINPACARASQLAISLARSLPKGIPASSKSETEKDSENQIWPSEELDTKPPRQHVRPCAEASAKASTSACGEGRMLANGGTYCSHCSKA